MLISVVLPVYNRESYICSAVQSVILQTYKNWELAIVDDHSTDDTYFSILPLIANIKNISYFILDKNYGVSFARNYGIRWTKGEYIAFLDSDDYWLPSKLEKQLKFMQKHNYTISQTDEFWERNHKFVNPKIKHQKIADNIFDKSLEMCIVSPSAVMMKREFFDKVGLFDNNMPACEDYDLWLRASLFYKVGLFPEKLIVKRGGHDDQLSKNNSLDKYRIYALLKLLLSGKLTPLDRDKVLEALDKKINIYIQGCRKREKRAEVLFYNAIIKRYLKNDQNSKF